MYQEMKGTLDTRIRNDADAILIGREDKVGTRDISELVKKATRASEAEAMVANAPAEAIKAAGDAAAELVSTAALEQKNPEELALVEQQQQMQQLPPQQIQHHQQQQQKPSVQLQTQSQTLTHPHSQKVSQAQQTQLQTQIYNQQQFQHQRALALLDVIIDISPDNVDESLHNSTTEVINRSRPLEIEEPSVERPDTEVINRSRPLEIEEPSEERPHTEVINRSNNAAEIRAQRMEAPDAEVVSRSSSWESDEESGQRVETQDTEGGSIGNIILCSLFAVLGGLMLGYNFSTTGLVIGMSDFLNKTSPGVLEVKNRAWGDTFCKYRPRLTIFLTYLPLILACASRFFAPFLCVRLGVRNMLRASFLCIVIGATVSSAFPTVFFWGASAMGCGLGLASMAIQMYVYQATSSRTNRARFESIYNSIYIIGVSLAGVLNYIFLNTQPWGWRVFYAVGAALGGILLVVSVRADNLPTIQQSQQPIREIFRRRNRPALLLSSGSQVFKTLAGGVIISFFSSTVFSQLGLHEKTFIVFTVLSLVISVIGLTSSYFLLTWWGRRICLLGATITMVLSLAGCTWLFHQLMNTDVKASSGRSTCTLLIMFAHVFSYTVCFGAVNWLKFSLPKNLKWTGISVTSCFNIAGSFIVAQIITSMICKLKAFTFIVFIVFDICQFAFVYYFLPETKGISSTEEMEDKIWRRHWYWQRFMPE